MEEGKERARARRDTHNAALGRRLAQDRVRRQQATIAGEREAEEQ